MKNSSQLITVLFVCALFTSCQKEPADRPLDPVLKDSVTVLSKFISFDVGASAGDTAFVYNFMYDAEHRVTTINEYDYNNGTSFLYGVSTFYYTGTDSLPFKTVFEEVGDPLLDTTFYFYDNLQRLIKDSSLYNSGSGIREIYISEYIYSPGMIVANIKYTDNSTGPYAVFNSDTGFIGSNGNIIKTITNDPGFSHLVTTYFEYDDHPNPFYLLNIRFAFTPVLNFESVINYDNFQKNNVLRQTKTDILFPGDIQESSSVFTYNTAGLVETADISDLGQYDERIVYVYKKL